MNFDANIHVSNRMNYHNFDDASVFPSIIRYQLSYTHIMLSANLLQLVTMLTH